MDCAKSACKALFFSLNIFLRSIGKKTTPYPDSTWRNPTGSAEVTRVQSENHASKTYQTYGKDTAIERKRQVWFFLGKWLPNCRKRLNSW